MKLIICLLAVKKLGRFPVPVVLAVIQQVISVKFEVIMEQVGV